MTSNEKIELYHIIIIIIILLLFVEGANRTFHHHELFDVCDEFVMFLDYLFFLLIFLPMSSFLLRM